MFNSYGSRRGNDRVMTRGTFANVRVRNRLADGKEGGWTRDFTDGQIKSIYDASLSYKERGIPLIVSVVVVLQAVLHSAFSLVPQEVAGRARASTGEGSTNHDTGSTHMGSMPMDLADMSQVSTGHMEHTGHTMSGSSSFGMLAAHLLAALLCGLWLAYGECAAFRILRAVAGWLAAPLRLLLALPVPPHRTRVHARRREDQSPRRLLLHYAITSRGPPMGTAVA